MKKFLSVLLAVAMTLTLCACGKDGDTSATSKQGGTQATSQLAGTYNVTLWVPELAVELTKKQVADFNASNTDGITFNATIEAVSEAEAATTMITDVESGADIFFFAQDQSARLIQSGAVSKLGEAAKATVSAANSAGVVTACMSGEDMYAYPLTADNGYFMYYDKRVVPEADVDSLEKLIADCEAAGKTFCFEMQTSAWYLASFFFGAGCVSEWETGDDGDFIKVNDTFNSEKGLAAAKGIYKLVTSSAHVSSSDGTQFDASIPAAIVVTGTWDYNNVKNILGDNMGVADLPSWEADGKTYHLGSYNGCKLLGVKPQTDAVKSAALHKLAQYLISEAAQLERFNELAWGPSDIAAQASEAVQANPGLVALNAQAPYSVPQGQIHGSWWDIGKVIGTDIKDSDGTNAGLQSALQKYQDTVAALFNMTSDEKEAWSVIGDFEGTNWDKDFPMTRTAEAGDATFYSDALNLKAGNALKVRQGASWDVNFGGDGALNGENLVVPEDGVYFVKLVVNGDLSAATLTLEKTSFYSWSAIGTLNGTNWDADFGLEIQNDGKTFKLAGVTMAAGTEFKVRKDHSWDNNYGANGEANGGNVIVAADGTYTIVFDSSTGLITLE